MFFRLNWLTYLVTGAVALVASSLLTGCVFGNKEVDQNVAWDGVSGYYDTEPTAVTFCVTFVGQTQPTCATGALDQVPSALTSAMVDPMGVKLEDSAGDTAFFDPNSGSGLTLTVNASTLAISPPSGDTPRTYQAWPTDANCVETDGEVIAGKLTDYTGTSHTSNGLTITGRVALNYQTNAAFSSNCSSALEAMTTCYENLAQCGGTGPDAQEENGILQQSLSTLYTTLINPAVDLGILSLSTGSGAPADSIQNLQSISLSVSYQ